MHRSSSFRRGSIPTRNKSNSLINLRSRHGGLINGLPDIRSRSPQKGKFNQSHQVFHQPMNYLTSTSHCLLYPITLLTSVSSKSYIDHISNYADPLGVRRLGVYKLPKFSISLKSRATEPTSSSSFVQHCSMASEKTSRFAKNIPYE